MVKLNNLLSIVDTFEHIGQNDTEFWNSFREMKQIEIHRENEFKSLSQMVKEFLDSGYQRPYIFEDWIVGYELPQISQEIDLVKISDDKNSIVDIELKYDWPEYNKEKELSGKKRVQCQQKAVKHYLRMFDNVSVFTFVASESKFFQVIDDNTLIEVSVTNVIEAVPRPKKTGNYKTEAEIAKQNKEAFDKEEYFEKMLMPENFLVSPYNQPLRFLSNKYLLTQEQFDKIGNLLTKTVDFKKKGVFSISGVAGSGKTLMAFDVLKKAQDLGKKSVLILAAKENKGILQLRENGTSVYGVKSLKNILLSNDYEVVIIDETQRIYGDTLIALEKQNDKTVIPFFDAAQVLGQKDSEGGAAEFLETKKIATLGTKIRTNTSLANFIHGIFNKYDKKAGRKIVDKDKIKIEYFTKAENAKIFLSQYSKEFQILNLTASKYNVTHVDNINVSSAEALNTHDVIGQEFENVALIVDKMFVYGKNGKPVLCKSSQTPYFSDKMWIMNFTRAKNKLMLIIVDNEPLLRRSVELLK